jgi:hypothetical protein
MGGLSYIKSVTSSMTGGIHRKEHVTFIREDKAMEKELGAAGNMVTA